MSTPNIVPHPKAVLHLDKLQILLLLAGARAIYTAMLAEVARFPSPNPALSVVQGQTNTLETAQQLVSSRSGGKAATAARNTARDALWISLESEKAYVQGIADASPANAVEIIKSAGFDVALEAARNKPILAANLQVTSGAVKLVANVGILKGGSRKPAIYNWAYSLDGGHTWVSVPPTVTATTVISGLPVLTNCSFRVCVTLANVMQPWSPVVTIAVH